MMKIACLVKFIPDVEKVAYDPDAGVLVREDVDLITNPDDACALAFALAYKAKRPDTFVEIVSMGPSSVIPLAEDLLRRHADRATVISDASFAGSDTYVTSRILARYLEGAGSDLILTGSSSLDGDTAHVPSNIAELLKIGQMFGVVKVHDATLESGTAVVEVDSGTEVLTFEMTLPCIVSMGKENRYPLPYVRYKDLKLDVRGRVRVVTNETLGFPEAEVGIRGSLTRVSRIFPKAPEAKERITVCNDNEGIEAVYCFLKSRGFV